MPASSTIHLPAFSGIPKSDRFARSWLRCSGVNVAAPVSRKPPTFSPFWNSRPAAVFAAESPPMVSAAYWIGDRPMEPSSVKPLKCRISASSNTCFVPDTRYSYTSAPEFDLVTDTRSGLSGVIATTRPFCRSIFANALPHRSRLATIAAKNSLAVMSKLGDIRSRSCSGWSMAIVLSRFLM